MPGARRRSPSTRRSPASSTSCRRSSPRTGRALESSVDALARFDLWAARASLAEEMDATRAATADRAEVVLLSARHPGLTGRVVPIDIRIGDGYTALVVTGPNTGGKTVTLRTLGLLSLMHQSGLHIPAEAGSRLPIWRDVFADIGDEQSVAQSLSTFSGHLRRIIAIVADAGPGTLVLLDELGAGTDPTEGSALAQALLDHFIRSGAIVAATTHYAELKAYAHTTPGARNAAVAFDLETLSPTYRLTIGLPGGSQAFAIAERLGLPDAIVGDARSRLTEAQRSFEATLEAIRATEGETAETLERARLAEERAAAALRVAQEERQRARRERQETVEAARAEADQTLSDLRDELAATRRTLERETITAAVVDDALARAETIGERLPVTPATPDPAAEDRPVFRLGDRARSRQAGWEGRIAALDKDGRRATLDAGGMRVVVDVDDLEAALGPAPRDADADRSNSEAVRLSRAHSVASSLDLRGARVDEALDALDGYLGDAALAGLSQVLIIHGLGTGALRDAVRTTAAQHPLVRDVRAGERGEGGDGATIVRL